MAKPKGQSDVLTEDELKKIMALPDRRSKHGARDYAVLLALANTPMRRGELISLNREDLIDEGEKKFITYRGLKKKSKKPYYLKIPITDDVFRGIRRICELDENNGNNAPLFRTLGKHGPYPSGRITEKAIDCLVRKYIKKAEIKKRISPHSFRATYLTIRGGDPFILRELSGHSNIAQLMPYVRAQEEKKREVALQFSFS